MKYMMFVATDPEPDQEQSQWRSWKPGSPT